MNFEDVLRIITGWALDVGVKIAVSLLILVITFRAITKITRKIEKKLVNGKRQLDKTLVSTALYFVRLILKAVVAVCIVGYLGVDTGGITALIASLGVGIGLAVNGALSNLAGGALILLTRPFKIDDFIEAQGYTGTVEDIHIVSTRLRTVDNKVVYIPNGVLSADTIVNYSEKPTRRVDLTFSVSYSTDLDLAKSLILDIIGRHEKILKDPQPLVRASAHTERGIDIAARAWVKGEDYWNVQFDLLEQVKAAFEESEIVIPYNQIVVHYKDKKR